MVNSVNASTDEWSGRGETRMECERVGLSRVQNEIPLPIEPPKARLNVPMDLWQHFRWPIEQLDHPVLRNLVFLSLEVKVRARLKLAGHDARSFAIRGRTG